MGGEGPGGGFQVWLPLSWSPLAPTRAPTIRCIEMAPETCTCFYIHRHPGAPWAAPRVLLFAIYWKSISEPGSDLGSVLTLTTLTADFRSSVLILRAGGFLLSSSELSVSNTSPSFFFFFFLGLASSGASRFKFAAGFESSGGGASTRRLLARGGLRDRRQDNYVFFLPSSRRRTRPRRSRFRNRKKTKEKETPGVQTPSPS